jgi:two-component system, cell cycle sensor histidine kinase and response regulator CckA
VYGIVTQAGGALRIYSEPGFGTTLTVLLPVTDQATRPVQAPVSEPEASGTGLVLVVEDEAAMREVTRRMLDHGGYQVRTAANGDEALEIVKDLPGRIDVLLTDVVMPKMLGRDVAERVQALQPGVRVLFMSGYTWGLLSAQGSLEPGVHLIEKPFSRTALLAKLRKVLSG